MSFNILISLTIAGILEGTNTYVKLKGPCEVCWDLPSATWPSVLYYPYLIEGILGGLLGSAFTHLNLVFARRRKAFMQNVKVNIHFYFPHLFFFSIRLSDRHTNRKIDIYLNR